jgi:hypothetical protein
MENPPLKFSRRRTRMISFRVSEREFEMLKVKSEAEGARSISDLARLVLCGLPKAADGAEISLCRLSADVQQLSAEVRRATELLETSRPSAPESPRISPRMSLTTTRKSNRGV